VIGERSPLVSTAGNEQASDGGNDDEQRTEGGQWNERRSRIESRALSLRRF
jgi:hypothetical protein